MKVVILGGGFGGVRCALEAARHLGKKAEISVIDRSSAHVFTPTLYEVASAYRASEGLVALKLRRSVSIPYLEIFKDFPQIRHIQKDILSVDLVNRTVHLRDGQPLVYDQCVFAVGAQSTDFGTPGVKEHAYFFKTLDDALRMNVRLHELFRAYLNGPQDKPLQIVFVGAGLTGVELAAEVACCLRKLGRVHNIHKKYFSLVLFEAANRMLPMANEREREAVLARLANLGVAVMENSPIESVHADHVKLKDGRVWRADMAIWTAGIQPNKVLSYVPDLPLTEHGKVSVDDHLQVKGLHGTFAIGDAAEFIDPTTQKPVPAFAQAAIIQGKIAAGNVAALAHGRSLKAYKPSVDPWIATIGGKFAVAHMSRSIAVIGFWGWAMRNLADLRYFLSILPFRSALALLKRDIVTFSEND